MSPAPGLVMHPLFWTVLLPVFLLFWWTFILWVVSRLCGWHALARHYRTKEQFTGRRRGFRSGRIGSGNYNGCLTLGADQEGLFLSAIFPFRIAHPALFIPWSDLKPQVKHHWIIGQSLVFDVAQVPHVKLRFPMAIAEELAEEANLAWERNESPC